MVKPIKLPIFEWKTTVEHLSGNPGKANTHDILNLLNKLLQQTLYIHVPSLRAILIEAKNATQTTPPLSLGVLWNPLEQEIIAVLQALRKIL